MFLSQSPLQFLDPSSSVMTSHITAIYAILNSVKTDTSCCGGKDFLGYFVSWAAIPSDYTMNPYKWNHISGPCSYTLKSLCYLLRLTSMSWSKIHQIFVLLGSWNSRGVKIYWTSWIRNICFTYFISFSSWLVWYVVTAWTITASWLVLNNEECCSSTKEIAFLHFMLMF